MTQLTNALDTFQAKGLREDLHDLISMVSPDETPLLSNLGDKPVKAVKTEWQTDVLAAPSLNNAQVQGFQYDYEATTPTTRVGNYTQIFSKERLITETEEVVDKAGRKSEVSMQKVKMGTEMKTDIEVTMLANQASSAGSGASASRMGGLRAWLASNDSLGGGGASGGYNQSTGAVDAATNGAQRAFTKTLLDDTIQSAYTSGGNPTILMVSPYAKRVFSTFMSDTNVAQQRYQASGKAQSTIVGAADAYLSDFGLIEVIPNRQMARAGAAVARNAFLIDKTKAYKGYLRKIQEDKDVAKQGDALPLVMKAECTIVVANEAAHGVVADIFGMSASA
jgi:hypothetical protein